MKFLPENKKKKMWSIGILAVSVLGIVYFNFFTGPSGNAPSGPVDPETNLVPGPNGDGSGDLSVGESDRGTAPTSAAPRFQSRLLPFGDTIDESILSDERVEGLQAAPEFEVSPEELGNSNLFGQ